MDPLESKTAIIWDDFHMEKIHGHGECSTVMNLISSGIFVHFYLF
jgi:hypothetical protein